MSRVYSLIESDTANQHGPTVDHLVGFAISAEASSMSCLNSERSLFRGQLSRGTFPRTAERITVDQDDGGNANSAQGEGPVTTENH